MEKREIKLSDMDVLKMLPSESVTQTPTSTVFEVIQGVAELLKAGLKTPHRADSWVSTHSGIPCQLLREKSGGWIKGILRLRLEFIPDNPEAFIDQPSPEPSPLDDLRSDLNIQ